MRAKSSSEPEMRQSARKLGGTEAPGARIHVGTIAAAHGIKGEVKVKSFTENPLDIAAYGAVWDEAGARRFEMTVKSQAKGAVVAAIAGVRDRNAAERLRGIKLYIPRAALPEPAIGEFYHADLIGLRAELQDGTLLGTVARIHNFGAGDVIEIRRAQRPEIDLPFTERVVPVVDISGGRIVVAPPEGSLEQPAPKSKPYPAKSKPARTKRRARGK